jgi:hypothetical protein
MRNTLVYAAFAAFLLSSFGCSSSPETFVLDANIPAENSCTLRIPAGGIRVRYIDETEVDLVRLMPWSKDIIATIPAGNHKILFNWIANDELIDRVLEYDFQPGKRYTFSAKPQGLLKGYFIEIVEE